MIPSHTPSRLLEGGSSGSCSARLVPTILQSLPESPRSRGEDDDDADMSESARPSTPSPKRGGTDYIPGLIPCGMSREEAKEACAE